MGVDRRTDPLLGRRSRTGPSYQKEALQTCTTLALLKEHQALNGSQAGFPPEPNGYTGLRSP